MVLDGLPSLYGLKYDSATACGLLLYLCSYKLLGSATGEDFLEVIPRSDGIFPQAEESVVRRLVKHVG